MDPLLRHFTAVVTNTETPGKVSLQNAQGEYTLTDKTVFMGPIDDKLAFASLRPGLNVNLWADDTGIKFASPNYK